MITTKNLPIRALTLLAAITGCASNTDGPSTSQQTGEPPVDLSVGTAVYGLSVRDCYAEATECFDTQNDEARSWVSQSLYCRSELRACLGDVVLETASEVVSEARDVTQCGQDGLGCYAQAQGIQETLDCRNAVEVCVNDNVEDLTGVQLPTTREIVGAAVETTQQVVETAVDVAEVVVDRAVDRAVAVADTAAAVAEGVAQVAVDVAEAATAPARHVIECTIEAQQCRFSFEDPRTCRRAYQACLFGGLGGPGSTPPVPPIVLN